MYPAPLLLLSDNCVALLYACPAAQQRGFGNSLRRLRALGGPMFGPQRTQSARKECKAIFRIVAILGISPTTKLNLHPARLLGDLCGFA